MHHLESEGRTERHRQPRGILRLGYAPPLGTPDAFLLLSGSCLAAGARSRRLKGNTLQEKLGHTTTSAGAVDFCNLLQERHGRMHLLPRGGQHNAT